MPIEIRARNSFEGKRPTSRNQIGGPASFFIQAPHSPTADVAVVERGGRDQEALGYDSTLVNQASDRPDVWATAGWILARTQRLKVIAAHRVGLQSPTVAARTFATLDQFSNGRIGIHIIQGRTDVDMQRDGDFLAKPDRYRRSHEYLEIFKRELTSDERFDFDGEFYKVRGAVSGVKPVQRPYPVISSAGLSDEGIELAGRHADVYAVPTLPLRDTVGVLERVRQSAAAYGRTIRFWNGGFNVILGASDDAAWQKTVAITEEVAAFRRRQGLPELAGRPEDVGTQTLRDVAERGDQHDRALYTRLTLLTGHGPSLVGSPDTVVDVILAYYDLGIEIVTLGNVGELYPIPGQAELVDAEHWELTTELIRLLHDRAAARDSAAQDADENACRSSGNRAGGGDAGRLLERGAQAQEHGRH